MKLQVTPIYGNGWFTPTGAPVDMPDIFLLEAEEIPEGCLKGHVSRPGHPLDRCWVLLSQRHTTRDGYYNLSAYDGDPQSAVIDVPKISGFVQAEPI